jgi:tetratricopeptide (TPR) repeat protein
VRQNPKNLSRPLLAPRQKTLRTPFIGRQAYLDLFAQMLREVRAGQPLVMFLQGEAGMGKSRLLEAFQAEAQRQGFATASSRCRDHFPVPYLPFVAFLQPLGEQLATVGAPFQSHDLERLQLLLQGDFPRLLGSDPALLTQAEQDKSGLCLAVSRALIGLARRQPLLVAIDDLHWADALSLDLLSYLVFTISEQASQAAVPLCLVAAHRPPLTEMPLAAYLPPLLREEMCSSLDLHGLREAELMALLRALGIDQPAPQLLHTVEDVTQGSPLFVHEVVYYLEQRQALRSQRGQIEATLTAADLRLPTQVTEVIVARTARMPPPSRDLLSLAALLGEVFSLSVLAAVRAEPETEVLIQLEEAVQQDLLVSEGQEFQFAHPLVRQALYHLPSVARRQRLHEQIAQTLIQVYEPELQQHSLEIAHHLMQAGPVADATAVVHYVRQAGDYAFALCDWRYAVQAYTSVLRIAESAACLPTAELAELYYRAGAACEQDGDVSRSEAYRDLAIAAYRQLGDIDGLARTLIDKTLRAASTVYGTMTDTQPLEDLLEEVDDALPGLRARIAVALSELYTMGGQHAAAVGMAQNGLGLGQQSGDLPLCARASFNVALAEAQDLLPQAAVEHYQQARIYAQQADDRYRDGRIVPRMAVSLLMLGRFEELRTLADETYGLVEQTNNWKNHALTLSALVAMDVVTGAFDTAERLASEALALVSRYRTPYTGLFTPSDLACAHALRGDWSAAAAALDIINDSVFTHIDPYFRTCVAVYRHLLQTYDPEGAPLDTGAIAWRELPLPESCDYKSLPLCCALVELSVAHRDPDRAAHLYRLIEPVVARGVLFTRGWSFFTPRILGLAAALNHWWDRAEAHFQTAMTIAAEIGASASCGRVYLDYAQMLLDRGTPDDLLQALERAQKASVLLRQLGMVPFVRRAEQLSEMLQSSLTPQQSLSTGFGDRLSQHELDILTRMSEADTAFLR